MKKCCSEAPKRLPKRSQKWCRETPLSEAMQNRESRSRCSGSFVFGVRDVLGIVKSSQKAIKKRFRKKHVNKTDSKPFFCKKVRKWSPKWTPIWTTNSPLGAQGRPKGAQGRPKGAQGCQKGAKRSKNGPKRSQNCTKTMPKVSKRDMKICVK